MLLRLLIFAMLIPTILAPPQISAATDDAFQRCARLMGFQGDRLDEQEFEYLLRLVREDDPSLKDEYEAITGREFFSSEDVEYELDSIQGCLGDVATEVAAPTGDEACSAFADFWMNPRGLAVTANTVGVFTGCVLNGSGAWMLPTGIDDPRLSDEYRLSQDEVSRTASFRSRITSQLAQLRAKLPTDLIRDLDNLFDPVNHVYHPESMNPWVHMHSYTDIVGSISEPYEREFIAIISGPEMVELKAYTLWWAQRRIAAFQETRCDQIPMCETWEFAWGVYRAPWPWDLADEITTAQFLKWLVAHGYA